MDTLEFSDFNVEELLNIAISIKDFKAIVAHCGIINTKVNAFYSQHSYPMLLTYDYEGVWSDFILMTAGGSTITPVPNEKQRDLKRPAPKKSIELMHDRKIVASDALPHLSQINKATTPPKLTDSLILPPKPSIQSDSLFLPQADDDRRWDPAFFDEEGEEILLWDKGAKVCPTLHLAFL